MEYEFEFDPVKSTSNLEKHGIDFVQAQLLWEDPDAKFGPAVDRGERREVLYARLEGRQWTAVFVQRGHKTRIISVRRSRKGEETDYEQAKR
jgi:uncharacterized protein